MKPMEMREMTANDLREKIAELESNLFDLRLQASMAKLQNLTLIRETKRDIARGKTILQEKLGDSTSGADQKETVASTSESSGESGAE